MAVVKWEQLPLDVGARIFSLAHRDTQHQLFRTSRSFNKLKVVVAPSILCCVHQTKTKALFLQHGPDCPAAAGVAPLLWARELSCCQAFRADEPAGSWLCRTKESGIASS